MYGEQTWCDNCCKCIDIIDYYNQDGLCVQCFLSWINEE